MTMFFDPMNRTQFLRLCAVLVCPVALAIDVAAKTPNRAKLQDWKSKVTAAAAAPEQAIAKANPVCDELTANVSHHIEKMQALKNEVAKSSTAPPATVAAAVKTLFGQSTVSKAETDKKQKLEGEKKTVAELNDLLVKARCKPVDAEHFAATAPKTTRSNPTSPPPQ